MRKLDTHAGDARNKNVAAGGTSAPGQESCSGKEEKGVPRGENERPERPDRSSNDPVGGAPPQVKEKNKTLMENQRAELTRRSLRRTLTAIKEI